MKISHPPSPLKNLLFFFPFSDQIMIVQNPLFNKEDLRIVRKREVYLEDGSGIRTKFSESSDINVPYIELCITKFENLKLRIDLWHGRDKKLGYLKERILMGLNEDIKTVIFKAKASELFIS